MLLVNYNIRVDICAWQYVAGHVVVSNACCRLWPQIHWLRAKVLINTTPSTIIIIHELLHLGIIRDITQDVLMGRFNSALTCQLVLLLLSWVNSFWNMIILAPSHHYTGLINFLSNLVRWTIINHGSRVHIYNTHRNY